MFALTYPRPAGYESGCEAIVRIAAGNDSVIQRIEEALVSNGLELNGEDMQVLTRLIGQLQDRTLFGRELAKLCIDTIMDDKSDTHVRAKIVLCVDLIIDAVAAFCNDADSELFRYDAFLYLEVIGVQVIEPAIPVVRILRFRAR